MRGSCWFCMAHPESGHVIAGSLSMKTSRAWAWHRPGYMLIQLTGEEAYRLAGHIERGLKCISA